jgi:TatD DNase family protein
MYIDTHAHLWSTDSTHDSLGYSTSEIPDVIRRARAAGVEAIIVPGTNLETSAQAIALAHQYPKQIFAAVGIHPEDISKSQIQNFKSQTGALESEMGRLRKLIVNDRDYIVAIGEVGTDARVDEMAEQQAYFRAQCELAIEYDLPVIIHTRESFTETLPVLDSLPRMVRGQFHCFSYDEASLAEVLERGFYVSLCGNISWSKRIVRLAPHIPADRILLETDSPFMTPLEKKPAQNEPSHVTINARILADARGETIEQLARQSTENARRLFALPSTSR